MASWIGALSGAGTAIKDARDNDLQMLQKNIELQKMMQAMRQAKIDREVTEDQGKIYGRLYGGGAAAPANPSATGGAPAAPGGVPSVQRLPAAPATFDLSTLISNAKGVDPNMSPAVLGKLVDNNIPLIKEQAAEAQRKAELERQIKSDESRDDRFNRGLEAADDRADRRDTLAQKRMDQQWKEFQSMYGLREKEETRKADTAAKKGTSAGGAKIPEATRKRIEAMETASRLAEDLENEIKQNPEAVGAQGNMYRASGAIQSQVGLPQTDEQEAAARIQAKAKALASAYGVVKSFSSYGGGKEEPELDVAGWMAAPGQMLPKLGAIRQDLAARMKLLPGGADVPASPTLDALPPGAQQIGTDARTGKAVYQLPDGSKVLEQ